MTNLIALVDIAAAPGLRDEVDRLRRAARENNVVGRACAKEATDFFRALPHRRLSSAEFSFS
jgi:hypothetical protein